MIPRLVAKPLLEWAAAVVGSRLRDETRNLKEVPEALGRLLLELEEFAPETDQPSDKAGSLLTPSNKLPRHLTPPRRAKARASENHGISRSALMANGTRDFGISTANRERAKAKGSGRAARARFGGHEMRELNGVSPLSMSMSRRHKHKIYCLHRFTLRVRISPSNFKSLQTVRYHRTTSGLHSRAYGGNAQGQGRQFTC